MPDDRPPRFGPPRDRGGERPGFPPRRPGFVPRPPSSPAGDPVHSVRLRDGDREIEASGSPMFVRQLLDDLPVLLARLRGDTAAGRPASISLPAAPAAAPAPSPPTLPAASTPAMDGAAAGGNGHTADPLEQRVLAVLGRSRQPIGIAEIRRRLDEHVSGQQVRRILERASDRVVNSGGRPAAYRIR